MMIEVYAVRFWRLNDDCWFEQHTEQVEVDCLDPTNAKAGHQQAADFITKKYSLADGEVIRVDYVATK